MIQLFLGLLYKYMNHSYRGINTVWRIMINIYLIRDKGTTTLQQNFTYKKMCEASNSFLLVNVANLHDQHENKPVFMPSHKTPLISNSVVLISSAILNLVLILILSKFIQPSAGFV